MMSGVVVRLRFRKLTEASLRPARRSMTTNFILKAAVGEFESWLPSIGKAWIQNGNKVAGWEGESSNRPAVAAPQLWRGTHFSNASSRLAAPKRQRRRVAGVSRYV
jgi:hypothetical protein